MVQARGLPTVSARCRVRAGGTLIIALLLFAAPTDSPAQSVCLQDHLVPGALLEGNLDLYGFSVARSENCVAVGAPGYSGLAAGAGAVFLYERFGADWELFQVLLPADLEAGDFFGMSLAIDGGTLVVGAPRADTPLDNAGSARVYERMADAWIEVAALVDPGGEALEEFGASVAIRGDRIVVGAPKDANDVGQVIGSATVFRRDGGIWTLEEKLEATFPGEGDRFGEAVAIEDGWIAVGAPGFDAPFVADQGSVTVFQNLGMVWSEVAFLERSGAQPGDGFGSSLAIEDDLLVVGAPYASVSSASGPLFEAGCAVPFRRTGASWLPSPTLVSPSPAGGHYFGRSVAIDGTELVVGEPFAEVLGLPASGAAHLYAEVGGDLSLLQTLTEGSPLGGSLLGASVAAGGGEVLVGAVLGGGGGLSSGMLLRFVTGTDDCDGNGVVDLCEIAADPGLDCDGNGLLDGCELLAGTASDCDLNGLIDICDVQSGVADCDGNLVPDLCELTSADCNGNGVLDGCEADCNANGLPDDCDIDLGLVPDCDGNGNPDDCDLIYGLASDCDGNDIPDSCDLASGAGADCNGNGVLDSCDLLAGTSVDADGDGIPDDCGVRFIRGDVNGDGLVNLADAIVILHYVSTVGAPPTCFAAADANADLDLDVADGVTLILYLLGTSPPLAAPFPDCGVDPLGTRLGCDLSTGCP